MITNVRTKVQNIIKRIDAHFHYEQLKTYVEALCIPVIGITFALGIDVVVNPVR